MLTGSEGTHGVGDAEQFFYSPSFKGNDSVFTNFGPLLIAGDPAPKTLPGLFSSFNSRPIMLPNGTAYWIGGITDTKGGGTQGRVLFRCAEISQPGSTTVVFQGGDLVDGIATLASGVEFDYMVSDNDLHMIQELALVGNTLANNVVAVNGSILAREASPTGQGDNWDNFDNLAINNDGVVLFSGDTDGNVDTDEFLAIDGQILLRQGDGVAGLTLGGAVNAASINDDSLVVFIWTTADPTGESLFVADALGEIFEPSQLLSVGDTFTHEGQDYTVDDFNASNIIGPGLDLAEDDVVYAEVDLIPLSEGLPIEAIIRIDLGCDADITGDGQVSVEDLVEIILAWGQFGSPADVTGDGLVNVQDLVAVILAWGPC